MTIVGVYRIITWTIVNIQHELKSHKHLWNGGSLPPSCFNEDCHIRVEVNLPQTSQVRCIYPLVICAIAMEKSPMFKRWTGKPCKLYSYKVINLDQFGSIYLLVVKHCNGFNGHLWLIFPIKTPFKGGNGHLSLIFPLKNSIKSPLLCWIAGGQSCRPSHHFPHCVIAISSR